MVGVRVDLRWVGRRGTLPTACGELCPRRRSSVLEPTLSVLKLGVRTGPKCQSDGMASAVASLVSGVALLTVPIRLGLTRRIGAITADVTARIGDGPLLAGKRASVRSRSDESQTSVCPAISRAPSTSMPRCGLCCRRRSHSRTDDRVPVGAGLRPVSVARHLNGRLSSRLL